MLTERLVDIDDDLLAAAQTELGTNGISETVRAALEQAATRSARAREATWLREGGLRGMQDPEERSQVWP